MGQGDIMEEKEKTVRWIGEREKERHSMPTSERGERSEGERTIGIGEFLERGMVLSGLDSSRGKDMSKLLKKIGYPFVVIVGNAISS